MDVQSKGTYAGIVGDQILDTSKDVCTYYTLRGREDNYVNTILDTGLR